MRTGPRGRRQGLNGGRERLRGSTAARDGEGGEGVDGSRREEGKFFF